MGLFHRLRRRTLSPDLDTGVGMRLLPGGPSPVPQAPLSGDTAPAPAASGAEVVHLPNRGRGTASDTGRRMPTSYAGIRFDPQEIEVTQQLAAVRFQEIVNVRVKLGQHFFSRIAIAQRTAADRQCILFVDRQTAPDDLLAVVELLARQGWELAQQGPQAYWTTSTLVVGLSQGHIDAHGLSIERDISRDLHKSSLFNAFMDVITWAYAHNADDVDFAVDQYAQQSQVAFKIGGRYIRPERFTLPTDFVIQMLGIAWQRSGGGASAAFDLRTEQQARIDLDLPRTDRLPKGARVRLRWSGMANDKGTVVTMRLQRLADSARIRSLEQAGYPASQMDMLRRVTCSEGGMVVLSGVVGSGKSTTLAQLMSLLPSHIKMISIEDPVELEIPRMYQKTIARDLDATGAEPAFLAAARALYRSALDVLLLGEIRDRETGLLARQVVEAGHSVYSTTHARSALGVIDRFVSPAIGMPREVLATPDILKVLVYQALLPANCPHCSRSPADHAHHAGLRGEALGRHRGYFDLLQDLYHIDAGRFRLRDAEGCDVCRQDDLPELNGFMGRTVVSEMVEPDETMLEHILTGNNLELTRYWRSLASPAYDRDDLVGKTAMECAVYKASQGIIDPREIEPRFMSFETLRRKRGDKAHRDAH